MVEFISLKEAVVKAIISLFLMLILFSGNVLAQEVHFVLEVNGMSCPFCVYGIEKQLKKINGVEDVSTSLSAGKFWVNATGPEVLSEEVARLLVEDAGFTLRGFQVHQPGSQQHEQHE